MSVPTNNAKSRLRVARWGIFLAVACHKFAEAFVVGVKLSQCAAPTGALLGAAVGFIDRYQQFFFANF